MNKMGFADRYSQKRAERESEFRELIEDPIAIQNELLRSQLIELRLNLGLTQKAFAELVGVKQPLISRLENGTQNITVNTLQSILARTNTGAKLTISVEDKELVHH